MVDIIAGALSLVALVFILAWFVIRLVLLSCTILEHERGLLYRRGRFQRVLNPGGYWFLRRRYTVHRIDMRIQYVTIPGQEVLTADNISIKISLAASFKVADPFRAINETTNYYEALYLLIQLRLRDLVGTLEVDDLLAKRQQIIGSTLRARAKEEKASIVASFMARFGDDLRGGRIRPVIHRVFPLEEAAEAHRAMKGDHFGKIVLRVASSS